MPGPVRSLNFGPLKLASRYLLSPLAGYTNMPFRVAVRELGGMGLATTELVSTRALLGLVLTTAACAGLWAVFRFSGFGKAIRACADNLLGARVVGLDVEHLYGLTFGIGIGTIVLAINVALLGLYTFSCHSLRHLIGGCGDCLSEGPAGGAGYACVSALNRRHMLFAWMSLGWVGFSDLYVRLCSMGIWSDLRIL